MRLSCVLLIVSLLKVTATGFAQDDVTSIKGDNITLEQLFTEIEKQTNVKFLYRYENIAGKQVNINVENAPIAVVLNEALHSNNLKYTLMENNLIVVAPQNVVLQGISISGTISDNEGVPMPGVNVMVKGTLTGSATDANGRYTIAVPDRDAVLVFSYIGYQTQEFVVGNQTQINVAMVEDARQLEEVVVVGYGTQKKVNLTGAVATVSGDDMVKRPVPNPTTMLQGMVPGLSLVQGTGQPGDESITLRVRGQGTYSSAGSDPLILIDGVPGNLTSLNANDIESVSVLKDAASASMYGARAANGVILVTTKTGKDDQLRVTYNANFGIHIPTRMLDLITYSPDYMKLFNEARTNSGTATVNNTYSADAIELYRNPSDQYPSFDWLDFAFNPALTQNHNLSLNGGARGTTYNISLGYLDQNGTMYKNHFTKYTFRTNIRSQLKNWITIGSNLFLQRGDQLRGYNSDGAAFNAYLSSAPTFKPILPDGSGRYAYRAYSHEYNTVNQVAVMDNDVTRRALDFDTSAQLWADVKLYRGLSWYTKGAVRFTEGHYKTWNPVVPVYWYHTGLFAQNLNSGTNGLTVSTDRTWYTNLYTYLRYDTNIAGDHNLGLQLGYSQETSRYDYLSGNRREFLADLKELGAGTTSIVNNDGYAYQWALLSYFGRLNYDYKGRYLLEANFRYDGTSRMDPDYRWGFFPSVSAGWRLTEEDFLKNIGLPWLDNLKLRGSYGLLGNQNVSIDSRPYPSQSFLSFVGNYSFNNSVLSPGLAEETYTNRAIQWESTSVFDLGVDITVFKGLSIVYDFYRRYTSGILRTAQVTDALGLNAPYVNDGAMLNVGNEISVQYQNRVAHGSFNGLNYGGGFYFTRNKNEVREFGVQEIYNDYNLRTNGLPYNTFYLLDWIGIFQTQEEIDSSPKQFSDPVKPGDMKYADTNRDGKVNNDDRIIINARLPKFEYSFNLFARWKGFDFSAFFQGVYGRSYFVDSQGYDTFRQGSTPTKDWLTDRWTGPGTSNTKPRITFDINGNTHNRRWSTWYLQDASYLRLKNVVLGYSLPKNIISRIRCETVRVYFSGDNLLLFTPYYMLDPERPGDGGFARYPNNKVFSFGLDVTF